MTLLNVSSLFLTVDATAPAPSFPDPTTNTGTTVQVVNVTTASIVLASVGATPFFFGGAAQATFTLLPGVLYGIQSDGVHWIIRTGTATRSIFAATGVTAAGGVVTFTFPTGLFAAAPVVDIAFQGAASPSPVDYRITALTATSCTITVNQSLATVIALLGLSLLAASTPLVGATIHLIATSAGSTP